MKASLYDGMSSYLRIVANWGLSLADCCSLVGDSPALGGPLHPGE